MDFRETVENNSIILTEGSMVERVRRNPSLNFDHLLANTNLIYTEYGQNALSEIYREYINVGRDYNLPMITLTPTWRANKERIEQAKIDSDINKDNFVFLNSIRQEYKEYSEKIFVGGLIGCAGDSYNPEEALSITEAQKFHFYQLRKLADAGVDFLKASTLPAITEAAGIAKSMSQFNLPYVISFVIRKEGTLLDGMPLDEAIKFIDSITAPHPFFYMVNCIHPTVLDTAINNITDKSIIKKRLLGIQANTSKKTPEELESAEKLDTEEPYAFAAAIVNLHKKHGIKILGGCCGTDERHIKAIGERIQREINV